RCATSRICSHRSRRRTPAPSRCRNRRTSWLTTSRLAARDSRQARRALDRRAGWQRTRAATSDFRRKVARPDAPTLCGRQVNKAIFPLLLVVLGFAASAAKPPKRTNELVALGRRSYDIWCVACHGETGAGDGSAAQRLDPKPRSFGKDKFKQGSRVDQIFDT